MKPLEARWNAAKAEHPPYDAFEHPVNLNVGKIQGGDWASSVPAWCTVDCRISTYPGIDPMTMRRDIEDTVAAAARANPFLANNPPEVVWNGFFTTGYALEPGSAQEATLARAHDRVVGGALRDWIATAYIDSRVWSLYADTPTLVYGPVCENAHGFDERVNIPSIRDATKAIALFIADWCGLEAVVS